MVSIAIGEQAGGRMQIVFPCVVMGMALLAWLLLAMRPARADQLGALLPVAIPGFGAAPGVTAASRLERGLLARPVSFGAGLRGLEIFPALGLVAGIDTAPAAGGTGGGAMVSLRPAVRVLDRALGLTGYLGAAFDRYARAPAADADEVTAALGAELPVGASRLTLGAAHVARTESELGLATGGGAAPLAVAADDGRIALATDFGGFTATERVSVGMQAVTARGDVLPAYGRRDSLRGEAGIATPSGGVLRALALLRADVARYDGVAPGSGIADATALDLLAGVESDAAAVWRLRVVGGVARARYAAGGPPSATIGVYDVALGWTPDPLVALELDIGRDTAAGSDFGVEGMAVTTERAGLAEAFARDLLLTASASARQATVAGRAAAELDLEAGARWRLSREFAVTPKVAFALRHDLAGEAPREARVTVSLAWTP